MVKLLLWFKDIFLNLIKSDKFKFWKIFNFLIQRGNSNKNISTNPLSIDERKDIADKRLKFFTSKELDKRIKRKPIPSFTTSNKEDHEHDPKIRKHSILRLMTSAKQEHDTRIHDWLN